MSVNGISALIEITDEAAESISGGFRFENYDDSEEPQLLTSGVVGRLNQRIRGNLASNVDSVVLESEERNGGFRIEIPSLGFNRLFYPDLSGSDSVFLLRGDGIPFQVDENTEVFVTDLGSRQCTPTSPSGCFKPDNSSGDAAIAVYESVAA